MLDTFWDFLVLITVHFLLMEIWRHFRRPAVVMVASMCLWIGVPQLVWPEVSTVSRVATFILLVLFLDVLRELILLIVWRWNKVGYDIDWEKKSVKTAEERETRNKAALNVFQYDDWVEYLYVNFFQYLIHLYSGIFVLLLDLVVQTCCVLLESLFGLHSILLLNRRLGGKIPCSGTFTSGDSKVGYVPAAPSQSPSGGRNSFTNAVATIRASMSQTHGFTRQGSQGLGSFFGSFRGSSGEVSQADVDTVRRGMAPIHSDVELQSAVKDGSRGGSARRA
jgi:hypothetical protein